jgi:transcriptional regulator with XRE-family HTH domain
MNITELCDSLGVSRPELCDLLGVTRQYLQHYVPDATALPAYLTAHIDTLMTLPVSTRAEVIAARLSQYASSTGS